MKNLIVVFYFLGLMSSFSQEAKKRQITPAQIDAIFSNWDSQDKPGIAVGILNDGEIIYTKGYGMASLEHNIPITPQTRFHIGDLAKEFTVYSLLLLEERNQLSLQDDIRELLPKLKSFSHSIRIEQLIHHTSGLNNEEVTKALAGWAPGDILTKNHVYTSIANQSKLVPKSGSEQLITDAGFMILEDLITQVSKMDYADFVTKEIFEPLKMTNSMFDTNSSVIPNKAEGYFKQGEDFVRSNMNQTQTVVSDVYTTVGDMCLWAKELRAPKIGTKQMMNKFDKLSVVRGMPVTETNQVLYTGGHRFWDYRGVKKLYHIEVAGGYASKLIRYPEYDLALVVMGNDGAYNGNAATGASEIYIEDFLNPISNEETAFVSEKLSNKQLSRFESDYWDVNNHASRKIQIVNDTLRYVRGPGNESALVPLTTSSFKMITWGEVVVSFDTSTQPKTMEVLVGDNISNLIAFDKNAEWTKNLDTCTGTYYAGALDTKYALILHNGKLVLTHPRLGAVQLDSRIPDVFVGNRRHFTSLKFKRDANGTVSGFHLATPGVADLWFQKETISTRLVMKNK